MSNDVDVDELLKKIFSHERFINNKKSDYEKFLPEFIIKTQDNLDLIETDTVNLEKDPENNEIISNIFRFFQNIKGSSSEAGQDLIRIIAHQTTTLLDGCRNKTMNADRDITRLILASVEYIRKICDDITLNDNDEFTNSVFVHIKNIDDLMNAENTASAQVLKDKSYLIDKINNELLQEFRLEIEEDLHVIEEKVRELSESSDKKTLNSVFRAVHTITGLAGYTGHTLIQRICIQLETLLESCRTDEISLNNDIINLILISKIHINSICNDFSLTRDKNFLNEIYLQLEAMNPDNFKKENPADDEFWHDFVVEAKEHYENIEMNVLILEKDHKNTEIINTMFRSFHTIKGLSGFVNQNLIQDIAHKTETLMEKYRKGQIPFNRNIVDIILNSAEFIMQICNDVSLNKDQSFLNAVNEHLALLDSIQLLPAKDESALPAIIENEDNIKKMGEILIENNILNRQEVLEVLEKQKELYSDLLFGQVALKENKANPKELISASRMQQAQKALADSYIRISTAKIDKLVNMIDELIKAQSVLTKESKKFTVTDLFQDNIKKLTVISKDMLHLSILLKMFSLKSTFQKISRIARDTINELDKDINFIIRGEDIEIDRNVAEKLFDPMLHLVKNAIFHGIEDKEERISKGKSPLGTVQVSAYISRGNVYIEISDDGKGIDPDKVYKTAVAQNLLDPGKTYSESEIIKCVLMPGFTTVKTANNISGRGVGLDVVKTEMQKVAGEIEINNKIGEGCTFVLKIPVKNAVIDGTIVNIYGMKYAIPANSIKQVMQTNEDEWINDNDGRLMLSYKQDNIQAIPIAEIFKPEMQEGNKLAVILQNNQLFLALIVQGIINTQRIVVKPLENEFTELNFLSGMAIFENEKIPVLDIKNLFLADKLYEKEIK